MVFVDSGVLNILIDICYTMADSNYNSTFTPQSPGSQYEAQLQQFQDLTNINERQRAMVMLATFWSSHPDIIQSS